MAGGAAGPSVAAMSLLAMLVEPVSMNTTSAKENGDETR
jgi:hypothetical protein